MPAKDTSWLLAAYFNNPTRAHKAFSIMKQMLSCYTLWSYTDYRPRFDSSNWAISSHIRTKEN